MKEETSKAPATGIHLISVDEKNAYLGNGLAVTKEQKQSNLVLSVPDAIEAAFANSYAKPYFISLDNKIIGYTALVFDASIPKEEDRYWLWQFTIDYRYQGKGYGIEAMEIIINKFKEQSVPVITLSTKPSNKNAIHLYQKFGFVLNGEMNDDEVILKKYL